MKKKKACKLLREKGGRTRFSIVKTSTFTKGGGGGLGVGVWGGGGGSVKLEGRELLIVIGFGD